MALFYRYAFPNNLGKLSPNYVNPNTGLPYDFFYLYAESEVEARRLFEKEFGVPAGNLLSRDRW